MSREITILRTYEDTSAMSYFSYRNIIDKIVEWRTVSEEEYALLRKYLYDSRVFTDNGESYYMLVEKVNEPYTVISSILSKAAKLEEEEEARKAKLKASRKSAEQNKLEKRRRQYEKLKAQFGDDGVELT